MKGRILGKPASDMDRLVLPRVGFLKIGYKNEKGLPQSVDYFIPVGKYSSLFTKAYGDKPQTIQIVFPDDDPAKVCCERYEYRDDDGRLIATGDGETFNVWNGKEYQELSTKQYPKLMHNIETRYPNKLYNRTGEGWQIILTLNFIVPCVQGIAGIWQFKTKGTSSTIPNIRGVFDAFLERKGFCKGIVFDLTVQYSKSQKPGEKNKYPVVSLIANESEENVLKVKNATNILKGIE